MTRKSNDGKSAGTDDTPGALPQELRDKLHTAKQNHLVSLDALRDAVCAYVDQLRGDGVEHGEIVRAIQSVVAPSDGDGARSVTTMHENARLVDSMIRWCNDHWHRSRLA